RAQERLPRLDFLHGLAKLAKGERTTERGFLAERRGTAREVGIEVAERGSRLAPIEQQAPEHRVRRQRLSRARIEVEQALVERFGRRVVPALGGVARRVEELARRKRRRGGRRRDSQRGASPRR